LGAAAALAKVPKVMEVAGTSAESTTRAVAPIRRRELIKRFFTISPRIFGWLGFNGWDSMAGIQWLGFNERNVRGKNEPRGR
jgi:hypothetical protein